MNPRAYDVVIVGGGIVGTAVARELLLKIPCLKLAIVEKELGLAKHQSGHNSGVIHSGIYYTPGTLKAKLCVEGLDLAYKYCDQNQISYKKCGKLIVATKNEELSKLHSLFERGMENGVKDLCLIDSLKIKEIEPNCEGIAAIWSPNTGIVDWAEVNMSYGKDCKEYGATIYLDFCVKNFNVQSSNYPIIVSGQKMNVECRYVVTCAGLFSDKLAVLSGCSPEPKIIPIRGDYLLLKEEKQDLIQTNIYPVPDVRLPFLDVHFTPRMDGSVWIGPNAIVSFKREGYRPTDIKLSDTLDILSYRGFQKLALNHWLFGVMQILERTNVSLLVSRLNRYVPKLQKSDVIRGPSGVRAQALNRDGQLVDDFIFDSGTGLFADRILHVRNAPSPAATSSLAIAKVITKKVEDKFNLQALYVS